VQAAQQVDAAQAGAAAEQASGEQPREEDKGDTVDAEFEEVKDDNKK